MIRYELRIFVCRKFGNVPRFVSQKSRALGWFDLLIGNGSFWFSPEFWHEMGTGYVFFTGQFGYGPTIPIWQLGRRNERLIANARIVVNGTMYVVKVSRRSVHSRFHSGRNSNQFTQDDLRQPSQHGGRIPIPRCDSYFEVRKFRWSTSYDECRIGCTRILVVVVVVVAVVVLERGWVVGIANARTHVVLCDILILLLLRVIMIQTSTVIWIRWYFFLSLCLLIVRVIFRGRNNDRNSQKRH
mmetsp:Transcript_2072/g.3671  ORF Transcript_2072/g.3671 Transcript_2072/m.3671 type:complete len:242 (+) Transcript_2072:2222-2947(+)